MYTIRFQLNSSFNNLPEIVVLILSFFQISLMRYTIISIFFLISIVAKSQTVPPPSNTHVNDIPNMEGTVSPSDTKHSSDGIYTVVEEYAHYKDGDAALMAFIAKSIQYPTIAVENEIQGKVYLNYIVNTDSTLSDITVARLVAGGDILNREAIRVLKLTSGNWVPAKNNGKVVRCRMNLPIVFKLQ